MSDPNPTTKSDLHTTPKGAAPSKKQPDTPFLHISSEGPLAGFKTAKDCEAALEEELKTCTTTMSEETSLRWFVTLFKHNGIHEKYYIEDLLKYLQDNGQYSKVKARWVNIPISYKKEDELYRPFRDLFECLIAKLRQDGILKDVREARITATTVQKHTSDDQKPTASDEEDAHKTKPDILIIGNNSKFLPKDFKHSRSSDLYKNAVVVVEMKRGNSKDTVNQLRAQLAMYARQCFLQQSNRHAVYGVTLTEKHFQLVVFDHSGAMDSYFVDMHAKPVLFIQCICFIIGLDLSKMGFDPSVTYEDDGKRQFIEVLQLEVKVSASAQSGSDAGEERLDAKTSEDAETLRAETLVTYEVTKLDAVAHARSIRGPGVVVRDATDANGAEVHIVDKWVHADRAKEVDIYKKAVEKGVEGLVPIKAAQKLDVNVSTAALRQVEDPDFHQNDGKLFPNLVLARLVLGGRYRDITEFESKAELLQVYRDAVQVHQDLLKKAQILHRGIQLTSVMMSETKTGGRRKGFLSDLSMAVNVGRATTLFGKDIRIIPRVFQSRHLLGDPDTQHHDCVEDLECFLYLILYIFVEYEAPGKRRSQGNRSELVRGFESQSTATSKAVKGDFVSTAALRKRIRKDAGLTTYFDHPAITSLLVDLCTIIEESSVQKEDRFNAAPNDKERDEMYKRFIDAIDKAIVGIQQPKVPPVVAAVAPEPVSPLPTAPPQHKSPMFTNDPHGVDHNVGDLKKAKTSTTKKQSTTKKREPSSKNPKTSQKGRGARRNESTDFAVMGADNAMEATEDVPTGSKRKLKAPDKGKRKGLRSASKRGEEVPVNLIKRIRLSSPIDLSRSIGASSSVTPDSPSVD